MQWWRPERFGATPRAARTARPDPRSGAPVFRRSRLSRGRYAGIAGEPRARAASAGLRHRIARPARRPHRVAALSPHLARIRDEKAAGRRPAADLAARPCVSRRRAQRDPPPGILDARMVSGRRFVARPDRGLRGAAARLAQSGGRRPRRSSGAAAAPMPGCRGALSASPRRSRRYRRHRHPGDRPRPVMPRFCSARAPRRAAVGIEPHPGDDWEALFFRIFLDRIEPHLGIGAPTVLHDYPGLDGRAVAAQPAQTRAWPSGSSSMSAASNSPTPLAN